MDWKFFLWPEKSSSICRSQIENKHTLLLLLLLGSGIFSGGFFQIGCDGRSSTTLRFRQTIISLYGNLLFLVLTPRRNV